MVLQLPLNLLPLDILLPFRLVRWTSLTRVYQREPHYTSLLLTIWKNYFLGEGLLYSFPAKLDAIATPKPVEDPFSSIQKMALSHTGKMKPIVALQIFYCIHAALED